MKKFSLSALLILVTTLVWGQGQDKATIMLLPNDHWCSARFFTKQFENQGKTIVINDYEKSFREDAELPIVLSKIGEILGQSGYVLKDYMMELRAMNDRKAEEDVTMSSMGSTIQETPLDMIRRRAKHDIELAVDWTVSKSGNQKVVTFSMDAIDTYTSMIVASVSGSGKPTNDPISVALPNAIKPQMKKFQSALDAYFSGLKTNGREITLSIRTWDGADVNLESEFDGQELSEVISDWVADNTVKSAFNLSDLTESRATFEKVRIPFLTEKKRPNDARTFASGLRKYLRDDPYGIDAKIIMRGLGEAVIIIGEK